MEDTTKIIETIHGHPYYTNKQLAETIGVSLGNVHRRKVGNEKEQKRYGNYANNSSPTNIYAYIYYYKYHKDLDDPIMRKHVPAYDPAEIAAGCGYGKRVRVLK